MNLTPDTTPPSVRIQRAISEFELQHLNDYSVPRLHIRPQDARAILEELKTARALLTLTRSHLEKFSAPSAMTETLLRQINNILGDRT